MLTIEKPRLLYQITKDVLFERYVLPLSAEGGRLPTGTALAKSLDVDVGTVGKAMSELQAEGLVMRKVGAGTFVIPLAERNFPVGIFLDETIVSASPEQAIYRILDQHIQQELAKRKISSRHYIDIRIPEFKNKPMQEIMDDTQGHRLRGLIVVWPKTMHEEWLSSLPIPIAGWGVEHGAATVRDDLSAFTKLCVEQLLERGCRKIAFVVALQRKAPNKRHVSACPMIDSFSKTLLGAGITPQNELIRTCTYEEGKDHKSFGRHAFSELWNSSSRPDGVVIYTDNTASGFVEAANENGIRLNDELHIACHAHPGHIACGLSEQICVGFPVQSTASQLVDALLNLEKTGKGGITFTPPVLL